MVVNLTLPFFTQGVKKCIRQWLHSIHCTQKSSKIFIPVCYQKFGESHGGDLHENYLAYRKRGRLGQCDSQQGARTGNMILRSILAEVFMWLHHMIM